MNVGMTYIICFTYHNYQIELTLVPYLYILLSQTFSGSMTSGNITLPSTDVTYTIQVTASVEDGDIISEGVPSPYFEFSLPEPGVFNILNYLSDLNVCFTTDSLTSSSKSSACCINKLQYHTAVESAPSTLSSS